MYAIDNLLFIEIDSLQYIHMLTPPTPHPIRCCVPSY